MTIPPVELIVGSSKGLGPKGLEAIAEASKNGLTENISGSDGKTHSSEVLVMSKMASVVEIDELEPHFHELGERDRKEEEGEGFQSGLA